MKHIRIAIIMTVVVGMSSCSLFQRANTTTRTARSYEVQTEVLQMPAVADLVIDSVYVRKDTTWTNVTFQSNISKSAMRKVLLGELLEEAQADVIVQPRENVDTKVHHPFKQSYHMEIFGYPARFRNFRNATEDDLRILNGVDPQPVNYNTIYIGGGVGNYSQGTITAPNTEQIRPKAQKQPKKPHYIRNKYIGTFEFGYNWFPIGLMNGGHGFVINSTHLWRTKNPRVYQGIGTGLNVAFGQWDNDNDAREWMIPVYYTPRFYFARRKVSPFFDLRMGGWFGIDEFNRGNNWSRKEVEPMGGMYGAGFLGLAFGKHVDIAFGTDQFFGGYHDGMYYMMTVSAKMSICF